MPKKREVASLVGNLSPVKRRRAILVKRIRHRRGEMGEELKRRAASPQSVKLHPYAQCRTFLEDRGSVDLDNCLLSVFVPFAVTHHEGFSDPTRSG